MLWPCIFQLLLLLSVGLLSIIPTTLAYPGMVAKVDQDPRPRIYRGKELAGIIRALRQGDYRLVRPSPTTETITQQHVYCENKIPAFLMTLLSVAGNHNNQEEMSHDRMTVSLHQRGLAAEALGLCFTNAPPFRDLARNSSWIEQLTPRQKADLAGDTLGQGLVLLLQQGLQHYHRQPSGGAVVAVAQAAETMWIAAFHHAGHLQDFRDSGAVQVLGNVIVSTRPTATTNPDNNDNTSFQPEYPYHPARAVMWAAAALQNLAANYCTNELGYCIWEWQPDNTSNGDDNKNHHSKAKLVLDQDTTLDSPEIAETIRQQIVNVPKLLPTLRDWICQGPIDQPHNETYGWPGDSQLFTDDTFNAASLQLQSPSLVPWAAAGVIKNLLLSQNSTTIKAVKSLTNLSDCLCNMALYSPDWLEQGKAGDAVYFWQQESLCPTIYDNCQDDQTWATAETGETCEDYTRERWCVEYGGETNEEGVTAKKACCLCGGGYATNMNNSGEDESKDDDKNNQDSPEDDTQNETTNHDEL